MRRGTTSRSTKRCSRFSGSPCTVSCALRDCPVYTFSSSDFCLRRVPCMGRSVAESSCWRGDDLGYKFSIHVRSVVSLGPPLRSLPGRRGGAGRQEAMRSAFPTPLPPLVAKGTMILPAKSADSRNVDDARFHVPPDGEADEDGIVAVQRRCVDQPSCRTAGLIVHFGAAARAVIQSDWQR